MKNPDIDENETYRIGRKAQSITAPHHLPDVWKQIALLKLSQALQMGGVFYFKLTDVHHEISQFITEYEKAAGQEETNTVHLIGCWKKCWIKLKRKLSTGFVMEYFVEEIMKKTLNI
ncbi:hypothetical protein [Bacillus swezeyi]|uniref:Uncharacterized protein n=1 Tax=Bacillus swezeyi TaxID=1925020 RepID=A0A5M8RZF8_9BACI|nr:hypothetical protein [Bacillus swezeyi]KAA6451222.1 hypothetical protein DX927_10480 [Bacillus swezeyi]KAA6481937.1 hypothetical protein DX928_02015 [Bacillus swezeyi]TYS37698.1 hypothetical protein FZC77_09910 [Bacillus swezeyi]